MAFASASERTSLVRYLRALRGRVEIEPRRHAAKAERQKTTRGMEALESRTLLSGTPTFVPGYVFNGGVEGTSPNAVVVDGAGNIYGSTFVGGTNGRGTIFEIAAGTTTPVVLDAFTGTDGVGALPNLVVDSSGNLFFTTPTGGAASNGSIVEIAATGARTPTVLHSFSLAEGFDPEPTLTIDSHGNLWGTTLTGGTNSVGEIFEIPANAINNTAVTPTIIYSFASADGTPGSLVVNSAGDIFGVTTTDGTNNTGQLFEIPSGQHAITPLASLPAGVGTPSLTVDSSGNLFGTTKTGGQAGDGTIFEYNAGTQTLNTLYQFTGASDGSFPNSRIVVDSSGNIFGTTISGGSGTVFELPAGQSTLTELHAFSGADGAAPTYGLVTDASGNLYGVTSNGGASSDGTLFSLTTGSTGTTASQLAFTQQPASGSAGALGTITVAVRDANGNIVTTDNSKVTLSIASGSGKLAGTLKATAVNGIATFSNVALNSAGTFTLQATDGSLTAATTDPFTLTVTASAGSKLLFSQQPATTAAGATFAPITVEVVDKKNNLVTSDNSLVTIALTGKVPTGGGFATGTLTVQAVNGVATFNDLSFDIAGKYTLVATDGALKSAKSKAFTVNPDTSSAHLVLSTPPSSTGVVGGKLGAFSVSLEDQFGNILKNTHSNAVVSIAAGPAGGQLGKSTSASINSGTAKFKNVTVLTAGTYTLQVADTTLTDASNLPVTFAETIAPGTTLAPVIKPAKSYAVGKTITLNANLKSNAPSTVPYSGTAIIMDSNSNILGTVAVSSKGQLKATITNLAAGTYACTLSYTGDLSHTDVLSSTFTLTVA